MKTLRNKSFPCVEIIICQTYIRCSNGSPIPINMFNWGIPNPMGASSSRMALMNGVEVIPRIALVRWPRWNVSFVNRGLFGAQAYPCEMGLHCACLGWVDSYLGKQLHWCLVSLLHFMVIVDGGFGHQPSSCNSPLSQLFSWVSCSLHLFNSTSWCVVPFLSVWNVHFISFIRSPKSIIMENHHNGTYY